MKKKEKGITLIALVVTIVVLLILAGVAISMLTGENGIINQALQAKEQNEIAEEKEKVQLAAQAAKTKTEWGEITEENLAEELTKNIGTRDEDYTLTKNGETFTVTYTDSNRSYEVDANGNVTGPSTGENPGVDTGDDETGEIPDRTGLKVGDYINYMPDANTEGYSADKLTPAITGSTSNTTINQDSQYTTESQTGMTWQILRIYDDGSIDLIGSPTSQTVYFSEANGYNNGVTVMNDICEILYSRGNIKARSVNYEDIESWLTDEGKKTRDGDVSSSGVQYGHTQTYIGNRYYPNLYAQEIGAKIDSGLSGLIEGIDKETGNTAGLGISEEGTASGYKTQASSSLTVTRTYWRGEMSSQNFGEGANVLKTTNSYWVASRYADCRSSDARFGLRNVYNSSIGGLDMFASYGSAPYNGGYRLRPLVHLPSSVQIEVSTENDVDSMHKITQY